jgi:hypothetical protein
MKGTAKLFGGFAATVLISSCVVPVDIVIDDDGDIHGSGRVVTESRSIAAFDGVAVSAVGRLIVEQTGYESLTVTAEDNILPHLRSRVVDGLLELGPRAGVSLHPRREIVYHLTAEWLTDILGSGAVEIEAYDLDTPFLGIELSGASHLDATGIADEQLVFLSGASGYFGRDLWSAVVTIHASGASHGVVRVEEFLEATASGTSLVEYIGNPRVVAHESGFGEVRRY